MMSDNDVLVFSTGLTMDNKHLSSPSWKLFDFHVGNLTPEISKWIDQPEANHSEFKTPTSQRSGSTASMSHEETNLLHIPNEIPSAATAGIASNLTTLEQERFRSFHEEKWEMRYKELLQYRRTHGDCLVPHSFKENPQLGRWVKRQRRQYKILVEGKNSTMTPERVLLLEDVGFVWDSHEATFQERAAELAEYRKTYGSAIISSKATKYKQLYTWVKGMRRQYKLYWLGKRTSMTPKRIAQLEEVGFEWEVRPSKPNSSGEKTEGNGFSTIFDSAHM